MLLSSERKLMGSDGACEFKGVPQSTMKVIDAGKARIKPTGVWLKYGKLASAYDKSSRDWLKSLPELELDLKKIKFNLPGEPLWDKNARFLNYADVGGLYVMRTEVTRDVFLQVMGKWPSGESYYGNYGEGNYYKDSDVVWNQSADFPCPLAFHNYADPDGRDLLGVQPILCRGSQSLETHFLEYRLG